MSTNSSHNIPRKESLFAVKIRMSWLCTHPFRVTHWRRRRGMTQIRNSFRSIFATLCLASCPFLALSHSATLRPVHGHNSDGSDFQPPRYIFWPAWFVLVSFLGSRKTNRENFTEKLILRTGEADDNDLFYLSLSHSLRRLSCPGPCPFLEWQRLHFWPPKLRQQ